MDFAQYYKMYLVNPNSGEVILYYASGSDHNVLVNPSMDDGSLFAQVGATGYTVRFSGTDDHNGIFGDNGFVYISNADYEAGDFIPNYATAYALRDTGAYVACFLSDTMISTPGGQVAVQNLIIGDRLLTADGRTVPVKWIGRQGVMTLFAQAESRAPICVSAGALGPNLPARDLKLTADHALLLDGVLV